VQVKEPDERERPVLQALRGDPSEIRLGGPAAQKLLRQYPDSRYLQGARVEQYLERERQLFRESPSDVEEAPEVRRTQRASAYQGMLDELLAKNWGKYDDARLGLLLRFAQEAGDQAAVERARAEIVERFPDSALAEQIRHK